MRRTVAAFLAAFLAAAFAVVATASLLVALSTTSCVRQPEPLSIEPPAPPPRPTADPPQAGSVLGPVAGPPPATTATVLVEPEPPPLTLSPDEIVFNKVKPKANRQ